MLNLNTNLFRNFLRAQFHLFSVSLDICTRKGWWGGGGLPAKKYWSKDTSLGGGGGHVSSAKILSLAFF